MDRNLKESYDLLYNTDLKNIEANLDKFIEAKHQRLEAKTQTNDDHR